MVLFRFLRTESGAVTVDWTVLAAAVAGLGIASVAAVRSGTHALGSDIQTSLSSASVVAMGELGDDGQPFEYTRLHHPQANEDWYLNWMSTQTDEFLMTNYTWRLDFLMGDLTMEHSRSHMDMAYFYGLALQSRGIPLPTEPHTVESVYTAWRAANP